MAVLSGPMIGRPNRWLVVGAAVLIQLCLGAIYAWSVFTKTLTKPPYGFSGAQTQWIFSVALATFALVMVGAGHLQKRIGPRSVALTGGVVLGLGYVMAGIFGSCFAWQLLFVGIMGGAGIGLVYVVPIAVCMKWFPDKKGLITGIAVAGFGFGATIWVKSAGSWFGLIQRLDWFGLGGVQSVFILYGLIFMALVCLGAIWMVAPPAGYRPRGWRPPEAGNPHSDKPGDLECEWREMLRRPQFYMLFTTFMCSAMAGLMVIGCIRLFGIDALRHAGLSEAAAGATAGTAMALYAILNGLGRIAWGGVSDKLGRRTSIFLMCLMQSIVMFAFFYMGKSEVTLIIGASIIGFNFGGNFALFPAAVADLFGDRNVSTNYPLVFLAYGLAGILGPVLAGRLSDDAGGVLTAWQTPFLIASVACLAASVVALTTRAPRAVAHEAVSSAA